MIVTMAFLVVGLVVFAIMAISNGFWRTRNRLVEGKAIDSEMKPKYRFLSNLLEILKALAFLNAVGAIIGCLVVATTEKTGIGKSFDNVLPALAILAGGLFTTILILAIANAINVVIDIEQSSRLIAKKLLSLPDYGRPTAADDD